VSGDDKGNDGGHNLQRSLKLERPPTPPAVIKGSVFTNLQISGDDDEDDQRKRKEDIEWIYYSFDLDTSFQFKPIEESESFKDSESSPESDHDKSSDAKSGRNSGASTFSAFVDRQRTNASSDADDEGSSATDEVATRKESSGSANGAGICHDNDSALLEGYRKAGQENAAEALSLLYQTRRAPGGFSVNKVDKNGMRDDERIMCLATLFSSDTSFQFFQNYFSRQNY
jgi:hypothetical protein